MVRTQLYLDEDLHEKLRELSKKQGRTVSELVREALRLVYLPSLQTDERVATLKEIDGLWAKEAEDRIDAYEGGKIRSISLEKVLEKYR